MSVEARIWLYGTPPYSLNYETLVPKARRDLDRISGEIKYTELGRYRPDILDFLTGGGSRSIFQPSHKAKSVPQKSANEGKVVALLKFDQELNYLGEEIQKLRSITIGTQTFYYLG